MHRAPWPKWHRRRTDQCGRGLVQNPECGRALTRPRIQRCRARCRHKASRYPRRHAKCHSRSRQTADLRRYRPVTNHCPHRPKAHHFRPRHIEYRFHSSHKACHCLHHRAARLRPFRRKGHHFPPHQRHDHRHWPRQAYRCPNRQTRCRLQLQQHAAAGGKVQQRLHIRPAREGFQRDQGVRLV